MRQLMGSEKDNTTTLQRILMTATNYSAKDTALLIVDPYNDFMNEGGKLYERTKETAATTSNN